MSRFNGKVSYLCIVIANKQDGLSTLSLIIGRVRLYHIISYFFPVWRFTFKWTRPQHVQKSLVFPFNLFRLPDHAKRHKQ